MNFDLYLWNIHVQTRDIQFVLLGLKAHISKVRVIYRVTWFRYKVRNLEICFFDFTRHLFSNYEADFDFFVNRFVNDGKLNEFLFDLLAPNDFVLF